MVRSTFAAELEPVTFARKRRIDPARFLAGFVAMPLVLVVFLIIGVACLDEKHRGEGACLAGVVAAFAAIAGALIAAGVIGWRWIRGDELRIEDDRLTTRTGAVAPFAELERIAIAPDVERREPLGRVTLAMTRGDRIELGGRDWPLATIVPELARRAPPVVARRKRAEILGGSELALREPRGWRSPLRLAGGVLMLVCCLGALVRPSPLLPILFITGVAWIRQFALARGGWIVATRDGLRGAREKRGEERRWADVRAVAVGAELVRVDAGGAPLQVSIHAENALVLVALIELCAPSARVVRARPCGA